MIHKIKLLLRFLKNDKVLICYAEKGFFYNIDLHPSSRKIKNKKDFYLHYNIYRKKLLGEGLRYHE